ncbi:hypothetical protein K443DRAFT_198964, partial [Laccaria amethystina LaAM-08-1]
HGRHRNLVAEAVDRDRTSNKPFISGRHSFPDSQFGIILRRQRLRPMDNSGSKNYAGIPSRFINLTISFEFAGWGSVTSLKLTE